MKDYLKFAAFISLLLLLVSCKKEETCIKSGFLQGTWVWEKSIGGIGGSTHTPQTEKVQKKLVIDEFFYREFEDNSLVFEDSYHAEIRQDSFSNTNKYLIFLQGGERAYWYDEARLEVHELCFDCFSHFYKRK